MLAARPAAFAAREARARANTGTWKYLEHAMVFVALIATTIFPAIAKYQASDAPMESPVAQVVWSVLYLTAAIRLISMRREFFPLVRGSAVLGAFVGLMFFSILWSVAPAVTFTNSIELIGTTLIGYYIVARFTLAEFLAILTATFATIGLACLAMIFGAPSHGRMDWGSGAWSGIFQEKNNLGAAMSLAMISIGLLTIQPKLRHRAVVVGVLVLCTILLIGTNSVTALVDCMFAAFVAGFTLLMRSPNLGGLARIGIVLGGLTLVAILASSGISPENVTGLLGRSSTLTGRTDFWPYIQRAIAEGPYYGYGYNAFFRSPVGVNYLSYYVVDAGGWTPYHAHNSFLQIALDAGYPGLAMLIVLIVSSFWRSIRYAAAATSRLAVWPLTITAYLLCGSFTETYFGDYNTFEWIFFVAALLYPLKHTTGKTLKLLDDVHFGWPGDAGRPPREKVDIAGVPVDVVDFESAVETILEHAQARGISSYVVTPNAHHVVLYQNDEPLRRIYDEAMLVVADGVPLLWAARMLGKSLPGRVNGTDLFEALCAKAATLGLRVFFLGGRAGAADAAASILRARHPELDVCGTYCPPFGFERDVAERANIVRRINDARPDLLFVGLGAPKQEYWMYANRHAISVPVSLGIGVSFEFVGKVVKRAPRWMQKAGLEWAFRLVSEPKRLWKRYVVGNSVFLMLVARQCLEGREAAKTGNVIELTREAREGPAA